MASKKTIAIVKSTAPILQQNGESITKVFYELLFHKHPELKNIFNMVNQKKGTQQRALANAVFQYAVHIEQLEQLGEAVEKIAQKHVSLSIPKEAYPIVGENLLLAIKKVLGEGATNDVMEAWEEAYNDLAKIFISREEVLYNTRENSPGGYKGMKEYEVIKKIKESINITSFYVRRKDGEQIPNFLPGQYITVTLDIPGTDHKHTRNYSLSDSIDKNYLRLSIKKEEGKPEGIVSSYIHNNIHKGSILNLGMPSGEFILKRTENPIVFISGGVGITPLLSMLKEAVKFQKNIYFIQCVLNSDHQSFNSEISSLFEDETRYIKIFSEPLQTDILGRDYDFKGFINSKILIDLEIQKNSDFYFCGPTPFMANVLEIMNELKVKEENINYEFFGPVEELVK